MMRPVFQQWIKRLTSLSLMMAVMVVVESCSTVPLTGRRQLSLVPSSEINSMSFQQYDQMISQSKVSTNQEWTNMVKTVGRDISRSVESYMRELGEEDRIEGFQWEFTLLAEDVINAWAMPGGKIAFYEGIMPICGDATGVAVVMGHEVAHAVARHGAERMSMGLAQQGLGTSLALALRNQPQATQQLALAAFGAGAQVGVQLPYSRSHESEADHLGLIFMARAGYDPREAPRFWQRMQDKAGGAPGTPEFLSTHPHPQNRIRQLNDRMPEAMEYYQKSQRR